MFCMTQALPVTHLRNRHTKQISDSRIWSNHHRHHGLLSLPDWTSSGTLIVKIHIIAMKCHDSPVAGSIVGEREFAAFCCRIAGKHVRDGFEFHSRGFHG